jgi:hypothetical protein
MKNSGQIIRSKKTGKSRYTPISNEIIQSETLTPYEKIILIYMLSLPEDWIIYKTQIQGKLRLSRKVFNDNWKGLVEKGYIHSQQLKREGSNLMGGYIHKIFEEPVDSFNEDNEIGNPTSELSNTGLSDYGKSEAGILQSNKEQSNKIQNNNIENNNKKNNNTSNNTSSSEISESDRQKASELADSVFNKLQNKFTSTR